LRIPILVGALVAFAIGVAISLQQLEFDFAQLNVWPLLILLLIINPLQSIYSATNLVLMAKATRAHIGFLTAVRVNVFAQLAELLPVPGGAIVRTGALVDAGARLGAGASVVLAFSLLWIALAAIAAGVSVPGPWLGIVLGLLGFATALPSFAFLAIRFGLDIALTAVLLRIAGIVLLTVRLAICFAAIAEAIALTQVFAFAFAVILGSAAALVPAGLAVGEGLSAAMAKPINVDPAAAFLAVSVSRILGLVGNAILAGVFVVFRDTSKSTPETDLNARSLQGPPA